MWNWYGYRIFKNNFKTVSNFILEGGLGNLEHISECCKAGLDYLVLKGMIFADNNLFKIKNYLANQGFATDLGRNKIIYNENLIPKGLIKLNYNYAQIEL